MALAESTEDRLVGLDGVMHFERRVFVVKAMESLLQFFLVVVRRGFHGEGDQRFRKSDLRHAHRMRLGGERIVAVCVVQLGHTADVAGVQA